MNRPDLAAVLAEHADCVANDSRSREWIDGSAVTGYDVWSCGLEIAYVDDFDDMHRVHLAAVLNAAVDAWLADEQTVDIVWNVLDDHGHNGIDCRPRAGFDLSIAAALAALTQREDTP